MDLDGVYWGLTNEYWLWNSIFYTQWEKEPYQLEDLASEKITAETLVWSLGFTNWRQAKDVSELSGIFSSMPPPSPMIMPKTWFVESVFVTCVCCLPFGIAGIINATKIENYFAMGDYERANYYSQQAKKWTLWGFFSSLTIMIVYLMVVFVIAISSN